MKLIINSITEFILIYVCHEYIFLFLLSRSYYICPIRLESKTFRLKSEYLTIILTKFTEYITFFLEI